MSGLEADVLSQHAQDCNGPSAHAFPGFKWGHEEVVRRALQLSDVGEVPKGEHMEVHAKEEKDGESHAIVID